MEAILNLADRQDVEIVRGNRAAAVSNRSGRYLVIFGRPDGAEFVVSHAQPSRTYGTAKGAARAVERWLSA